MFQILSVVKFIRRKRERWLCSGMDWEWLRYYSAEWKVEWWTPFLFCRWDICCLISCKAGVEGSKTPYAEGQDYLGTMSGSKPLHRAEPFDQFLIHHRGTEKPRCSDAAETPFLSRTSLPPCSWCISQKSQTAIWTKFSHADVLCVCLPLFKAQEITHTF